MKKAFRLLFLAGIIILPVISCSDDDTNNDNVPNDDDGPVVVDDAFIRGADMSFLPEIEAEGTIYYNSVGIAEDALLTLKNAGCNTVRVRLWKNPATPHSGFEEVKAFAQRIKDMNMKVWLTVHYSDTWADPGHQDKPGEWEGLSFEQLKIASVNYTSDILTEIAPDIIQIGNETNTGFMYPEGNLVDNEAQFLELVNSISAVIRAEAPNTKIMLHHAGITGAEWFFNKVANVDYDYIGMSYYPIWHGKDLATLQNAMISLSQAHNKEIIIAETAYPFTLEWNDWTNNIMGLEEQLIPAYPATPNGQKEFLLEIRNRVKAVDKGIGFCYWGAEWTAFRGEEATNGSTWENQALWDFDNKALPVLQVFNNN